MHQLMKQGQLTSVTLALFSDILLVKNLTIDTTA